MWRSPVIFASILGGCAIVCFLALCLLKTPYLLPDLPEHECGFAISVHRAQGSGYKEVTFLLPGYESKVLTRELLYTGITRAAASIEIWGSAPELLFALSNRAERSSNLFQTT